MLRRLGEGERRTRRRWIAAAAGVAAAAVIVSVTVVRVIESGDSTSQQAGCADDHERLSRKPVAVPMELTAVGIAGRVGLRDATATASPSR